MTTSIKKDFVQLVELLQTNSNKKVSTLMPQILELATKKSTSSADHEKTFITDDDGNVVAVFCYYHKKWELTKDCEYGPKKSSASGLNTMCKVGVSAWTRQQRASKKANDELLDKLASEEIQMSDLASARREIEETRLLVEPRTDVVSYDTFKEVSEVL